MRAVRSMAAAAIVTAMVAAAVAWLNVQGEAPLGSEAPLSAPPQAQVARGAYLARAGNCIGCHTVPAGALLAGGRGVVTPFGTVFAPNLTPDEETGLGRWTSAEFWRAMHHGRSKDGRLLYPAFPYPSFTEVTREDSDAIYAYLRSVPAVKQANLPHALQFPYSSQAALAVWRAMFFRPRTFVEQPGRSAEWNRGKYLVQGLGHCAACHSSRNALGATSLNPGFGGGLMPDESWYAPALADPAEAGLQGWSSEEVVRLLKSGVTPSASASGPMADVVFGSTQHLDEADLDAMAQYLTSLPPIDKGARPQVVPARQDALTAGGELYDRHCASCHGDRGQGVPGIYPALAGNRAVALASPNNLVQIIRHGGFAPTTAGNPRPFGMPPFEQVLGNEEVAALATYLRQSWGHQAGPVTALQVGRIR